MLHLFEEAKRSRLAEQVYKLGLTLCHSIIYVCWCVSVRLPLLANSTNNKTANQVANEIITKCCQRVFPAYTDLGEKSCLRVLFAVFGFITSPDVVNYDTCNWRWAYAQLNHRPMEGENAFKRRFSKELNTKSTWPCRWFERGSLWMERLYRSPLHDQHLPS